LATTDHPIKQAALAYAERGFRVIAIHRVKNGCCSCSKGFNCPSAGKHPVLNEWQTAAPLTEAEVDRFFGGETPYNIGIATGPDSNLLVLDVDPKDGGKETLAALRALHGSDWLKTHTVETGSGGWHFYFTYPDFEVGNTASSKLGAGLDTRGKGGQVVAPPSVSAIGGYTIIRDRDVIAAPDWMLELLRPKERKVIVDTDKAMLEVDPAERARLDGYTEGAVKHEVDRLLALASLGWNGPPWDITTFEVACNLIQLANAPWSNYTNRQAYEDVYTNAPRDPGFDDVRVNAKFESAERTVGDNEAAYPPRVADAFWLGDDDEPAHPVTSNEDNAPVSSNDDMDDFGTSGNEPEAPEIPQLIAPPYLFGIPVVDGQLDPDWERKARAQLLGTEYREREYVEILPAEDMPEAALTHLLAGPVVDSPQIRDLSPFEGWLRASLRSGTPELLYAALRVAVAGVETDAPTIVFKGGGPLLRVLAHTLRPAVGDDGETMLVGPRISTREVDGPQVVFEFDEREMDLLPYAEAIIDHAIASGGKLEPAAAEQHDELEDLTDYRAAQLHRARLGMGSRPREGAEL
jgi:hypothetical protein